uniref:Nucleosome assembly protein 1-like 1 n=1 Tax=Aceria tosichella TaxID=561515 RepID=A0A6G1S975_9ACAR
MDKFDTFALGYDGSQYPVIPKFMKRRVDALKKLQLEHIKIQHEYNKRLQQLELEFEEKHRVFYDKRAEIINGREPTDEECQLPANLAQDEYNGDQENGIDANEFTEKEQEELASKVKGLPCFWLGCLSSTYNFSESIEDHDRPVLKYLNDIKLSYKNDDDTLSYVLDFHFDENPYFKNSKLSKTYYLKVNPDENDPFSYEGFEVFKSEGCQIDWFPGKDVTKLKKNVVQKNKANGATRLKEKEVERDSFFYFFKPPQVPESTKTEDIDEEMAAIMAVDFELGELIRQSLIPKAVLYYNGFMTEDDDDSDMDDDESLGEHDDDSEDSDEALDSDEDSDEDGKSADSLAKKTA